VTAVEALQNRQPFEFGHYGAVQWEDGGAYEVIHAGRTVAIAYPGREPMFNEAHPAYPLVKKHLR
jgi:hypothetical protein